MPEWLKALLLISLLAWFIYKAFSESFQVKPSRKNDGDSGYQGPTCTPDLGERKCPLARNVMARWKQGLFLTFLMEQSSAAVGTKAMRKRVGSAT
jgi:hypothetical protein